MLRRRQQSVTCYRWTGRLTKVKKMKIAKKGQQNSAKCPKLVKKAKVAKIYKIGYKKKSTVLVLRLQNLVKIIT